MMSAAKHHFVMVTPYSEEMRMTKRATVHFHVTSYAEGTPWIVIEPFSGGDLALFQRTIGFDLPAGTTFEEAESICKFLQDNIEQITET